MDEQPKNDERNGPTADDGIIGGIDPVDAGDEASGAERVRRPGLWRRRTIVVGCLLAILGLLLGGGIALMIGRQTAEAPRERIDSDPEPAATVNRLIFSPAPDRPEATPDIIPAETAAVYCFFELGRLPADAELEAQWWGDGEALGDLPLEDLQREQDVHHASGRFTLRSPAETEGTFAPGIYEVEVRGVHQVEVSVRSSFVVLPQGARILQGGGEPEGPPVIRSLRTATDVTEEGEPVGAATDFPPDVGRICAVFEYRGITPGAVLTARWHLGDMEIERARTEIAIPDSSGWAEVWLSTGEADRLPPGPYQVAIHLGDEAEPLASVGFTISSDADAQGPDR